MINTILAIDLGTQMGWALYTKGQPVISGSMSLKPSRFSGGGERYLRFLKFLEATHDMFKVDMVVYEEVRRHSSTDAAHVYGSFMGHLSSWCEGKTPTIPYSSIPVGTIKKHATGKGNASKEMMIEAAIALGYKPADDNEADALMLLHTVCDSYSILLPRRV